MYIYHHLGLGDHIICNAIVRNIYNKYPKEDIFIFCKPKYVDSIAYMYRDLPDVQIIAKDDVAAQEELKDIPEDKKIIIGHQHYDEYRKECSSFDEAFYRQTGLSFKRRWDDFFIKDDPEAEQELYDRVICCEDYAFVHDDAEREYIIDDSYISEDLFIFRPKLEYTSNIFLYKRILENAKEIHCIDSCFKNFVDSIDIQAKLFFHISHIKKDRLNISNCRHDWNKI